MPPFLHQNVIAMAFCCKPRNSHWLLFARFAGHFFKVITMTIYVRNIDRIIDDLCYELSALHGAVERAEQGKTIQLSGFGIDIVFDKEMREGLKKIISEKKASIEKLQQARDAAQNKIDELVSNNLPFSIGGNTTD